MLQNEFEKYLLSLKISSKSLKNYKSDLSHFTGWIILKLKSFGSYVESLSEAIPFLGRNLVIEYKDFMSENHTPNKTINRRLSTLRHLSRFLITSQIMDYDFMDGVINISEVKKVQLSAHPLVGEFKSYLEDQDISKNTIKNYLSDIRQFLSWLEINHEHIT